MKLIRYYGKARNFNSIGCVKKRENSDRNSYFFNLCSAAFTMIFFTLSVGPSIHFQQILWKNCFLPKWNIWLKWIKHIPKENHHNKTWLFFLWKSTGAMMWQKITMSSCNKTFKQVLSFLSNLTSALFILRIALSSHFFLNSKQVSELVELVVRKCSVKTVFLEISQSSQENTSAKD